MVSRDGLESQILDRKERGEWYGRKISTPSNMSGLTVLQDGLSFRLATLQVVQGGEPFWFITDDSRVPVLDRRDRPPHWPSAAMLSAISSNVGQIS